MERSKIFSDSSIGNEIVYLRAIVIKWIDFYPLQLLFIIKI